ncbi:RNA polymerase sigma factor [Clostridium culturomicium]|uniref:RNA polymerase sigma factor n=2 Tax=Clostridium culturomicium TaxID=1499683 RepID=UPI0009DD0507
MLKILLLMNTLLSKLNISEREIVILHLVNDLTFKDISKILNRPLGSIAWQYNSALKKLRRFQYE